MQKVHQEKEREKHDLQVSLQDAEALNHTLAGDICDLESENRNLNDQMMKMEYTCTIERQDIEEKLVNSQSAVVKKVENLQKEKKDLMKKNFCKLENLKKHKLNFLQAKKNSKNMNFIFCKLTKTSKNMNFIFCKL